MEKIIESHPFEPFIPDNSKVLMLGTFPPKPERWSMEFFYPNWINDMWRIMGSIFYEDPLHFVDGEPRRFDLPKIKHFLCDVGIALYDTGVKVIRHKDNASDKYLEIVERIDLQSMLKNNASITSIVTAGEKATSVVAEIIGVKAPKMGEFVDVEYCNRQLKLFRMPSSSRAYPMSLAKKVEYYATMFAINDIHL